MTEYRQKLFASNIDLRANLHSCSTGFGGCIYQVEAHVALILDTSVVD